MIAYVLSANPHEEDDFALLFCIASALPSKSIVNNAEQTSSCCMTLAGEGVMMRRGAIAASLRRTALGM